MVPTASIFIVLVSTCFVLFHGIQSAPNFNYASCTGVTFTANGPYEANLNKLLTTLSSNATSNKNGFFNFTVSTASATVYGLYMCRGDLSVDMCSSCVSSAIKQVVKNCSTMTEAIIWYDECTLRYSDANFFGSDQEDPQVMYSNNTNIADPNQLAQFTASTMGGEMASQAASSTSGKKYAAKVVNLSSDVTLYSMVQCTPDLPAAGCVKCIKTAVSNINPGKISAKNFLPSCVTRYESYLFYNASAVPVYVVPTPSPPQVPPSSPASSGKKSTSSKVIGGITVPVAVLALIVAAGVCILLSKRAKKKPYDDFTIITERDSVVDFSMSAESLQYDFSSLQSATNNFSDENKLGQGGFGGVYRGKLSDGKEIAVKRLSQSSGQGGPEFKNEVMLVAKLQHRNLVRLLGFCLSGKEKLLVYEYVCNKSLDCFLFDPEKQVRLNWTARYKIIEGIARGMIYLHEDSRLRIIHRDLKPSNILLDADMVPKISDFGMAKIFGIEELQGNTNRVVGTYGYMAPEYAIRGEFSVKSDVYSFGVLVLEIISGQKINHFCIPGYAEDLISYAWKKWKENEATEFMDPKLKEGMYSRSEVNRCIHMGLLCVQESVEARPTMSEIGLMLRSQSVSLPVPKKLAFYSRTAKAEEAGGKGSSPGEESSSNSKSFNHSVNDLSITQMGPR